MPLLTSIGAFTVAADPGLDAYLAAIGDAERSLATACERIGSPPEGRVWLRLGPDGVEIAPADARAAEAAAFWAEAALGAREAAARLYGAAAAERLPRGPVMIETGTAGGVTVHDGAEAVVGDPCEALKRMAAALGGGDGAAPFEAARAAAVDPNTPTVAIGGSTEVALGRAPPAGAVAKGPDGVHAVIADGDDGPALTISAAADAAPGEAILRIYDPADPFTPAETIDVRVLPGAPPPPAGGGALRPGAPVTGRLATGGDATMSFEVAEAGVYEIASDAVVDLTATLQSADGRMIARDDDSGAGYGFALRIALEPGAYSLNLSHCCGGGGLYSVTATPVATE